MTIKLFNPHRGQREVIKYIEDDSVFFITCVIGRQWGKSLLGMNTAVKWAVDNKKCVVYWISPVDSQAHKVYKQILDAIYHTGVIKSNKGAKGDTEIVLVNGSKILFRSAASEDSLRGESVDYMILDEGAFIKKETVDMVLLPMLNVKGKKCMLLTTPKSKNYVYDWFLRGSDDNFPDWKSFRFSTLDSPYSNDNLIEMFKNTLPQKLFEQEILAEFIDSASVFNNINELMVLDPISGPVYGGEYYGGIDIGLINDASVLSILDGDGNLIKYYRFEKVESPELIEEIVRLNSIWKFRKIYIENNNQGLTIYQELKRKISCIRDINTNQKTKPEMINKLIHAFNMKEIKLVKDELLRIELEAFIFKQRDGKIKFEADSGFHDDIVMSLAMARECISVSKYRPIRLF